MRQKDFLVCIKPNKIGTFATPSQRGNVTFVFDVFVIFFMQPVLIPTGQPVPWVISKFSQKRVRVTFEIFKSRTYNFISYNICHRFIWCPIGFISTLRYIAACKRIVRCLLSKFNVHTSIDHPHHDDRECMWWNSPRDSARKCVKGPTCNGQQLPMHLIKTAMTNTADWNSAISIIISYFDYPDGSCHR